MNSKQMIYLGLSIFIGAYFIMKGYDLVQVYRNKDGDGTSLHLFMIKFTDNLSFSNIPFIATVLITIGVLFFIIPPIVYYFKQKGTKHHTTNSST